MRKKRNKVIIPEGAELMDYLNRGFAICNRCGAVMDRKEDPRGGCDIYACPSCGWEIDEMEYEYESGDPIPGRYAARRMQGLRRTLPSLQGVVQDVRRLSIINAEEKSRNRGFSSLYLLWAQKWQSVL